MSDTPLRFPEPSNNVQKLNAEQAHGRDETFYDELYDALAAVINKHDVSAIAVVGGLETFKQEYMEMWAQATLEDEDL